jgi:hypothetical protein
MRMSEAAPATVRSTFFRLVGGRTTDPLKQFHATGIPHFEEVTETHYRSDQKQRETTFQEWLWITILGSGVFTGC